MEGGGGGISGNRLLYVLLLLVSLVSVVAIIVAAVSLTNSDGDTPSISVNSGGSGSSGNSNSGSNSPIVINNGGGGGSSSSLDGGRIWTIAIGHDYGAHNYVDEKGYLRGFLNDLIYAVCEYGAMDCRLIWDDYVNCWDSQAGQHGHGGKGLFNNWYDACAGWYATVTRIQVLDFSLPFMKPPTHYSFFVKQGVDFDKTDITGKKIGFMDGWAADEKCLARQEGIVGHVLPTEDIVHFLTTDEAAAAVNGSSIDAIFGSGDLTFGSMGMQQIDTDFVCELTGASMMTTKDNSFNSFWNIAFQKYRDSGKFSILCKESQEAHADEGNLAPCVDAP